MTAYANSGSPLYPISVWENHDGGRREIIRTYELKTNEKPEDISRESFVREGWFYELAEVTKRETANADARDHSEAVTIDTAINEMTAILRLLEPTINYRSDDGYIGVLYLDISSIEVESAGTRSSSFSVAATREYPHLSSNDTSLIPNTITDNGKTLTLSNIDWRVQNYTTIDYAQIPDTYTAVVTYTGTGWRTTTIGYITTAEYHGVISKILTGKTVYTAYFIGAPIVTADEGEPDDVPDTTPADIILDTTDIEQPSETVPSDPDETEPEAEQENEEVNKIIPLLAFDYLPLIIAVLTGAIIGGIIVFIFCKKAKIKSKTKKRRLSLNEEKTD